MITVKWRGEFQDNKLRKHTSHLTLTGESLEEIHGKISTYVEALLDKDWDLYETEIEDIKTTNT